MTDKVQKIRAYIEKLHKEHRGGEGDSIFRRALRTVLFYIDSMQEEPVSIDFEQELYKTFGQVKDFTLGMRIAKRFYEMGRNHQEPVSDDFEATLAKEWQGYVDRGAATVDALEDNTQELAFAKGFYRGWHYPKVSVWHDTTDMPDKEKKILVVGFNGEAYAGYYNGVCSPKKINHWSYIDDLLKL